MVQRRQSAESPAGRAKQWRLHAVLSIKWHDEFILTLDPTLIEHFHAAFGGMGKRSGHWPDGLLLGQGQAMLRQYTAENDLHLVQGERCPYTAASTTAKR